MPVTGYDNESKDAMDFDNVEMVDCRQVLIDPSSMAKLLVSDPLYASNCSIIVDEKVTLSIAHLGLLPMISMELHTEASSNLQLTNNTFEDAWQGFDDHS
jgi:hypothetical protein